MSANWVDRWLALAAHIAGWSKDPSTRVGAILVKDGHVISTGYNGFPRGVNDDPERLSNRPVKYQWTVHAEMNAILQAGFHGHATRGAAMFSTQIPCSRCATALIQAGIAVVWFDARLPTPERWTDDALLSCQMLTEAGIPVKPYHGPD